MSARPAVTAWAYISSRQLSPFPLHVLAVAQRVLVRRGQLSMLPRYKDLLDGWQSVRYNFGAAKQRPRMDRFTWEEKLEYWSLAWGTL